MAVNFLNSMAFGLNAEEKKQMGEMGAIEVRVQVDGTFWNSHL